MSEHPFSPAGRKTALDRMAQEPVDLLVIGGGITGAGLARDAVLRGLKVALVEKSDFGYGTSSRSTKLVHGGIRYLAYGDVGVVRESARERRAIMAIAPHLVHPIPMLYPLFKGDSLTKFRAGFFLFDKLAGATEENAHHVLKAEQVREKAPHLREPIKAGIEYGEYITDDARLTMENALSAALEGGLVANHAPVIRFVVEDGKLKGAVVRDEFTGKEYEVRAGAVVNATGPWAEELLVQGDFQRPKPLIPSKGIHLLFKADRLPIDGAMAIRSPSGREGFAIRRWDYVYVGTSDQPHDGSLEEPVADAEATADVLKLAQDCFPELNLTHDDIVVTWAGLRPLIKEEGKSTRDTSRHDEVWVSPEGLVTVVGGKLTTYRGMAARILKKVEKLLGRDLGDNSRTGEVPLPRGDLGGQDYPTFRAEMEQALVGRGVPERAARRISWMYGTGVKELLAMGDEDARWLEPLAPGATAIRGEVRLAVEQEMAGELADFMDRRSALLIFSDDQGLGVVEEAAAIMGEYLGWDADERARQVAAYRDLAARNAPPRAA